MGLFDKILGQGKPAGPTFQPTTPFAPGSRFLEYEVVKVLGRGGFGITYLCRDRNLQNFCVIKEFAPRGLVARGNGGDLKPICPVLAPRFQEGKREFLAEVRRLAKFNHPNIVRVTRFFEAHSTAYFAMSFETGLTLRDLILKRGSNFADEEIAGIAEPLFQGVLAMHMAGLVHRDIKPDNIIVRGDGNPVLIDLGAAVQFQVDSSTEHQVIATPAYAPPEQLMPGGRLGPWTDIYAIGATLYELVTGKPPLPAPNRLREDSLRPAVEVGQGRISGRLLHLIDSALSLDYSERPQSIEEFLTAFAAQDDLTLKGVIRDTSLKMTTHFLNLAKPNDGLLRDELVAFFVVFPVIDLSWRLGKGIPDKATFARLFSFAGADLRSACENEFVRKDFHKTRGMLSESSLRARLEEYAASYLLDRQQEKWTYELLRKQLVRNCLVQATPQDATGFLELIGDVIDRARGRIKKELDKALTRVVWIKTENGWRREIKEVR
ncbi:MAG TPA: serine/threonine-protein kinase [Verrucomicrobiae bacterium]|nr:serine/threonine-protein kinase [Verrucomicrobiae bacterium]